MNRLPAYSYDGKDGSVYSFVRDYQGNVRQVVNERGGVVQESDYYPYGMLFGESDVSGDRSEANRYRYGGKEYLAASGLNLYDFTARYLDPAMGAFLSSDPMQGDYKPLSPTLYCGADPVNRVDPTGEDIYTVGTNGALLSHYQDDTEDLIIIGTQNLHLPQGTIQHQTIEIEVSGETKIYSYYTVGGGQGKAFFEFMANNCTTEDTDFKGNNLGVEISFAVFGEGADAIQIVSTSSTYMEENSFPYYINLNIAKLPALDYHIHSHNKCKGSPNPNDADKENAGIINRNYRVLGINKTPKYYVYYLGTKAEYTATDKK